MFLRIKPMFCPENACLGQTQVAIFPCGPGVSPSVSHKHLARVPRWVGRPAGVDGGVVRPGVLKLGSSVLGLHVLTGHRAGTLWKSRRAGSQPEGSTSPACEDVGDPHLPFSVSRETTASIQMLFKKMVWCPFQCDWPAILPLHLRHLQCRLPREPNTQGQDQKDMPGYKKCNTSKRFFFKTSLPMIFL